MTRKDWLIVIVLALASTAFRSAFLVQHLIGPDVVRLQGVDSWYQLRIATNLEANYPHSPTRDPYLVATRTADVPVAPGLPFVAATAARLSGSTSDLGLARIAAWIPPLFGGLAVGIIYVLGLIVRDRFTAVSAALLLAVLPGQFFRRTTLGFFDQHGLEVLLQLLLMVVFIAFMRKREGRGNDEVRRTTWSEWVLVTAGGLAIAAYCLSWRSAIMGIVMVGAATIAGSLVARRGAGSAASATTWMLLVALGALAPLSGMSAMLRRQIVQLFVLTCAAAGVAALAALVSRGKLSTRAATITGAGVIVLVGVMGWTFARPDLQALLDESRRLTGSGPAFVLEARSLFAVDAPLEFLWLEASLVWIVALIFLPWLFRAACGERSPREMTAAIWAMVTAVAMVLQIRFGYYAAAGMAMVVALGLSRLRVASRRWAEAAIVMLVLLSGGLSMRETKTYHTLPDAHRQLYEFLRSVSPEPFGEPAYLERYGDQEPLPAYSVAAWWDQGYWISSIARRVPIANPTQEGAGDAATLFLAPDEETADAIADRLISRYVIVDETLAVLPPRGDEPSTSGVFPGLVSWGGESLHRYYELVEFVEPGKAERKAYVFYPDYFRTLAMRLYLYQGQAVTSPEYWIGTFETTTADDGTTTRRLTSIERKLNYADAMNAQAEADGVERKLLSLDPLRTCIPLEELRGYRMIGFTGDRTARGTGRPSMMLFERGRR